MIDRQQIDFCLEQIEKAEESTGYNDGWHIGDYKDVIALAHDVIGELLATNEVLRSTLAHKDHLLEALK